MIEPSEFSNQVQTYSFIGMGHCTLILWMVPEKKLDRSEKKKKERSV